MFTIAAASISRGLRRLVVATAGAGAVDGAYGVSSVLVR